MMIQPKTNIEDPAFLGRNHLSFINNHCALAPLHLSCSLYICRERTTNQPFYAKQSQFPKKSNERK
jgi:hypothetical protein